jgi:hypothetical protein
LDSLSKFEFGVVVDSYKTLEITLRQIMQKVINVYKECNDVKATHRRLQWAYILGNATVKSTFTKKS